MKLNGMKKIGLLAVVMLIAFGISAVAACPPGSRIINQAGIDGVATVPTAAGEVFLDADTTYCIEADTELNVAGTGWAGADTIILANNTRVVGAHPGVRLTGPAAAVAPADSILQIQGSGAQLDGFSIYANAAAAAATMAVDFFAVANDAVMKNVTIVLDEETARCNFEADGYRLPTEAEWEYACRAGTTGEYPFGNDPRRLKSYAWYAANSGKTTHPVGEKKPNPWGLYDMLGDVAEWCNDVYDPGYYKRSPEENPRGPEEGEKYVLRGGAWNSKAEACRPSYRVGEDPGFQDACFSLDAIGFRCVRRAPAELLSKRAESD